MIYLRKYITRNLPTSGKTLIYCEEEKKREK